METNVKQFKAKCIQYLNAVEHDGDTVINTRHGKPATKFVPLEQGMANSIFGSGKGTVKEQGPIGSTEEEWDVDS